MHNCVHKGVMCLHYGCNVFSGPFWICTTLVFAIAISGNISTSLVNLGKANYRYTPEFRKGDFFVYHFACQASHVQVECVSSYLSLISLCFPVTIAATAIFTYAWLVPLALWGFLFWRNNKVMNLVTYSFMETVCTYGYSLAIYIPAVVRITFLLL